MGVRAKIPISDTELGKLPPQAQDVEMALLGTLITTPESYMQIASIVKAESFYNEANKIIFKAIDSLNQKNKPIDLMTVTRQLMADGTLDAIGGALYVTQLSVASSASYHYEHHARIIQQKYIQRELIRISYEIANRAYDESEDVGELLAYAQTSIEQVDKFTVNEGKFSQKVASDTIDEISEECKTFQEGKTPGVPSGLFDLNKAIGGWKAPYFVVMGARPGEGKTTVALHFAITAARAGFWVNFYSYEMTANDLFKILIAGASDVNRTHIRDGNLDSSEWALINISLDEISDLPIIWYDNPDITATQIRANTRKNKLKSQCDLIIADYIQLMPVEDKKANREAQVSDISRNLKRTALSQKVPIIALAQLNREVEKRSSPEVFNSDLRESGSLEQDADVILFLYSQKDEEGKPIERFMKISKNRRGLVGIFEYMASKEMTRIYDIDKDHEYTDYAEPVHQFTPQDDPF